MKRLQAIPLLLGLLFASTAGVVSAQSAGGMTSASPTREQIKMERDEFIKTHRWDEVSSNWVLNSGYEPPVGMKSRAEVEAERDEFLRNNKYDMRVNDWVPLKTQPRDLSTMSRAEVRSETRHFTRTHRWDDTASAWVEVPPMKKK